MLDLPVNSQFARDLTAEQFHAEAPSRAGAPAAPTAVERRAPVRRGAASALRRLADRLEPAPRTVRA
jgi:hypothetical protein